MIDANTPGSRGRNGSAKSSPTPRWVKVFAVIGVFLVVILVWLHLTGHGFGGHHGMRHGF